MGPERDVLFFYSRPTEIQSTRRIRTFFVHGNPTTHNMKNTLYVVVCFFTQILAHSTHSHTKDKLNLIDTVYLVIRRYTSANINTHTKTYIFIYIHCSNLSYFYSIFVQVSSIVSVVMKKIHALSACQACFRCLHFN